MYCPHGSVIFVECAYVMRARIVSLIHARGPNTSRCRGRVVVVVVDVVDVNTVNNVHLIRY